MACLGVEFWAYLVVVDPPGASDDPSVPGRAVADSHEPSLVQSLGRDEPSLPVLNNHTCGSMDVSMHVHIPCTGNSISLNLWTLC